MKLIVSATGVDERYILNDWDCDCRYYNFGEGFDKIGREIAILSSGMAEKLCIESGIHIWDSHKIAVEEEKEERPIPFYPQFRLDVPCILGAWLDPNAVGSI